MFTPILIGAFAIPIVVALVLSMMSRQIPESVGLVDGTLAPCPTTPNCVSSLAERADQKIDSIAIDRSKIENAVDAIQQVVAEMGGRVVSVDESYVHAVFTSSIFRFRDDVEFLVAPVEAAIHIRSASRVGRSDFGANRRRVETIRRLMNREP